MRSLKIAAVLAMLAVATQSGAAVGSAEKCAAAKMKAASKYAACRLAADSKARLTGVPADYSKCDEAQSKSWTKTEAKFTTDCPTSGDQATLQADLTAATSCVSADLGGPGSCSTSARFLCGNGVLDAGEACDQSVLDGATCDSATAGAKVFGTLACAADCTGFDTSACIQCPAGGAVVEGQCWILGNTGDSCTAACGLASMTTSDITLQMSANTASRCGYILSKLGADGSPPSAVVNGPLNVGCYLSSGPAVRFAYGSTQQGSGMNVRRLCGCE